MGLDMYLTVEVEVWPNYSETPYGIKGEAKRNKVGMFIAGLRKLPGGAEIKSVVSNIRVGYWRKANHIHNWFVKNVQEGEDNCAEYSVTIEQLDELRELCHMAMLGDDSALPTKDGFFFGSTDKDERYFQDCAETIKIIDNAKDVAKRASTSKALGGGNKYVEIKYTSSW